MEVAVDETRITEKYRHLRVCLLCRLTFKEIENIGRLRCRIHPGLKLYDKQSNREFYSCCGLYLDDCISGKVTQPYMAGCVTIDHMASDVCSLSKTNLESRLNAIKAFALIVVPREILSVKNLIPPERRTILVDFNGIYGMPREARLEHHIEIFQQVRHSHEQTISSHSPYYGYGPIIETIPLIDPFVTKKNDTITLDVHETSRRLDKRRAHTTTMETTASLSRKTKREGWATVTMKAEDEDEDDTGSAPVGRNKETVPFMVIRRIDDKLNIHPVYSKFVEGDEGERRDDDDDEHKRDQINQTGHCRYPL